MIFSILTAMIHDSLFHFRQRSSLFRLSISIVRVYLYVYVGIKAHFSFQSWSRNQSNVAHGAATSGANSYEEASTNGYLAMPQCARSLYSTYKNNFSKMRLKSNSVIKDMKTTRFGLS